MNNCRELKVWNEAMTLVEGVYAVLVDFPSQERFGLIDQIRRSAVSIPSNIAEGAARNSQREFYRFLGIASGSVAELSTQLEIAKRLKFFPDEAHGALNEKCEIIHKMIYKLQASVKSSIDQQVT